MSKACGAARARWAGIMEQWRGSGESIAAFCQRRGLAESSFYPWKRRLGAAGGGWGRLGAGEGGAGGAGFVEAKITGAGAGAGGDGGDAERRGGVAVELMCGRRVVVGRGFDRQLLREVIDALEPGGAWS